MSIPVIAAGGIADGRGMAAAFALGAEGVQVGTRFLTVDECTIADAYKERVIAAKDADTIVTGRGSGHPVRCLKNKFARTVRKLEGDVAANGDELEAMYVGSLKRAVEGDVDNGTMMAGQSAALVRERATAAEAIASLVAEAEELGGLGARGPGGAQRGARGSAMIEAISAGKPVLMLSGQGSQKPGMGADLMDLPEGAGDLRVRVRRVWLRRGRPRDGRRGREAETTRGLRSRRSPRCRWP